MTENRTNELVDYFFEWASSQDLDSEEFYVLLRAIKEAIDEELDNDEEE